MSNQFLRRVITPEVRVIDAKAHTVEYVASDETLDSYKEVIRAKGWRFDYFQKNSPFVDSHDYSGIERLVGQVIDFKVVGKQLVETVQWAAAVAGNTLAQLGWRMTEAGFLKAVSVGFVPVKWVSKWDDESAYKQELLDLGFDSATDARAWPRTVYTEQQQIELSAVIIGANPNCVARCYKSGALADGDIEFLSKEMGSLNDRMNAERADADARARQASGRMRELWLASFERAMGKV